MLLLVNKLLSIKKPLVFDNINDESLKEINQLFNFFDIDTVHINSKTLSCIPEFSKQPLALIIDVANVGIDNVNSLIDKTKNKGYIILYNFNFKQDKLNYKYHENLLVEQLDFSKVYDNFILVTYLKCKIAIQATYCEILSEEKIVLSVNFKTKNTKQRNSKMKKHVPTFDSTAQIWNYRQIFMLTILLLQSFVAFAFIGQNDLQTLKTGTLKVANREQRKNEKDKYVYVNTVTKDLDYNDALTRQQTENKEYSNIHPYLGLGHTQLIYNDLVTSNLQIISVADSTIDERFLGGFPVSLYYSNHRSEAYSGFDYGIIITSQYADRIIDELSDISTYSDLIGRKIVDNKGNEYSINNIIYVTDSNPNTEKSADYFKYHEHNVLAGKHLLGIYSDFAFVINAPIDYRDGFTYNLAYYPFGNELVDYIDNNYPDYQIEVGFFEFKTATNVDKYDKNQLYENFNFIYKNPPTINKINNIILFMFSLAFLILTIKTFIDGAIPNFKYKRNLLMLIPHSLIYLYLITVNLFSNNVYIIATAGAAPIVFVSSTVVVFGLIVLIKNLGIRSQEENLK